jgi:hypothetical protein
MNKPYLRFSSKHCWNFVAVPPGYIARIGISWLSDTSRQVPELSSPGQLIISGALQLFLNFVTF